MVRRIGGSTCLRDAFGDHWHMYSRGPTPVSREQDQIENLVVVQAGVEVHTTFRRALATNHFLDSHRSSTHLNGSSAQCQSHDDGGDGHVVGSLPWLRRVVQSETKSSASLFAAAD